MIRQSKTTVKELTAQYRSVLKKCALLNAMVLVSAAFVMPADAEGMTWTDVKDNLITGQNVTLTNDVTADSLITVTGTPVLDLANKTITGWAGQGLYIGNTGSTFTIKGTDAESAILSGFTSTSQGGLLQSLKDTIVNIDNVSMNNNGVYSTVNENHLGGALKISGEANITNSIFQGNTAKGISDTNYEGSAGAIYAGNASKLSIKNTKFLQNEADAVGAVGIFKEASLENVLFEKNKATSATGDGGGALFFGAVADATINSVNKVIFKEDESASRGGAISTRAFAQGNNSAAKLDIINTAFDGNKAATNGGAIDNYFYHSDTNADGVTVADSTFTANQAQNGGAIYNHSGETQEGKMFLTNTTFEGNTATAVGGAIYNEGTMTFNGDTSFTNNTTYFLNPVMGGAIYNYGTMTFQGNTIFANNINTSFGVEIGNDIYNMDTINFDGNVTLDGGISGNGNVTFAPDATLTAKLKTTTIAANKLTTSGATLNLIVDNGTTDGKYNFASYTNLDKAFTISDNALYDLEMITEAGADAGKISVAKKSISEVVSNLTQSGVNAQQAATIAAFADNKSGNQILNTITEAVQKGDAKGAAKLAEEVAPSATQIVLKRSMDVNNALSNITANRMDAVGRSGGDTFVGGSVWAQGLIDHTKQNSTSDVVGFSADTAGVSFGIDTKITKDFMLGIGYGYTNTDADSGNRKIDVDGHNFFVYSEYKPNNWYINGMFNYGFSKYDEQKIAGLQAKYDVNTYAANVMTGYDFNSGITPEIGLRYLLADQKSYNDGLQNISADNTDVLTGVAGFKYKADIKSNDWIFAPNLRLAATYDMISDDSIANVSVIGGGNYQITSKSLERLGVEAGVGLETTYKDWTLSINYNGGFRKDFQSHTGMLKAKYNF